MITQNDKPWLDNVNEWMEKLNPDVKLINEVKTNIEEERRKRKENFRKLHEQATTAKEDVMNRFYGIISNHNKPVRIDEVTLDRVLQKHGKNGMINISANRSDMPSERNDEQTKALISDLRKSGYSFLPTYGGYRGKNGVEDDYEPSFVVFNYTEDGQPRDFEELRQFALNLCGKYDQDSVLIKAPGQPPIWVDRNGNKVNSRESDKYVNPMPCQLSERMRRKGEVMIWE